MENKQYRYWCSMTPFICSIVPIGVAAGIVGLVYWASPKALRPGTWGCFEGLWYGPVRLCVGFLIAIMMVPMGIYSVSSGVAEIREPEARSKALVAVAIFLGILEIVAGSGFLFYLFRIFSN